MGEYAKYNGKEIKIGTCEDMLYLRYDQINMITPMANSLNPRRELKSIRFRFPWPDEDDVQPGAFKDHDKYLGIDGVTAPEDTEHYTVQFSARNGYLVSLPCPEGRTTIDGVRVGKNGYGGAVHLIQNAVRNGKLVPIFQCGGCHTAWRIEEEDMLDPYIAAVDQKWPEVAKRMRIKQL